MPSQDFMPTITVHRTYNHYQISPRKFKRIGRMPRNSKRVCALPRTRE